MEIRLQDSLGTCKTLYRTSVGDNLIVPVPAMAESEPSAILIFLFPAQWVIGQKKTRATCHMICCSGIHNPRTIGFDT